MSTVGRLAMSEDDFSFIKSEPPRGRIDTFFDTRRNGLNLNAAQQQALAAIKSALSDSRKTNQKHVVVLSGPQGSGKTLIALACVSAQLRDAAARGERRPVQVLMQGQTKEQWQAKLPDGYKTTIDSWSGQKWLEGGTHEVVIADEVHLMLPLGSGNARSGLNNLPSDRRLKELREGLREPQVPGPLRCPTIRHIERGVGRVLVLIRDESQVVSPLAMNEREFEACVKWLEGSGYVRRDVRLQAAHRTSQVWSDFVHRVFAPEFTCPAAVETEFGGNYDAHFRPGTDRVFRDPSGPNDFKAVLGVTPKSVEDLIHDRRAKAADSYRLLASFGWPYSPDEGGHVTIGGWTRPWNTNGLKDWAARGDYSSVRDGVGYVKLAQGMEFSHVGVFLGPDITWRWDDAETAECDAGPGSTPHRHGRWVASRDLFHLVRPKSFVSDDEVLRYSLAQARVLLLRARRTVVFYSDDTQTQRLLQSWFRPTDSLR